MALSPRARRPSERGAALFIVVLIVTLLTAIGVFAAHVTSQAQVAAGYSRRAGAAMHLGEFALNAIASDLGGREGDYHRLATASNPPQNCRANANLAAALPVGATPPTCAVIDNDGAKQVLPGIAADLYGAMSRDGSVTPSVRVEVTDVGPAAEPQEGFAQGGSAVSTQAWQASLTGTGSLLPTVAGVAACSPDTARASQHLSVRGQVVYVTPPQ
ncbi:MAG: hypothetical protein FJ104_00845 [Deltaproteobacteria bacterium]|nr:hypothetical protein [Deltaproteobacteria bacterium]